MRDEINVPLYRYHLIGAVKSRRHSMVEWLFAHESDCDGGETGDWPAENASEMACSYGQYGDLAILDALIRHCIVDVEWC